MKRLINTPRYPLEIAYRFQVISGLLNTLTLRDKALSLGLPATANELAETAITIAHYTQDRRIVAYVENKILATC